MQKRLCTSDRLDWASYWQQAHLGRCLGTFGSARLGIGHRGRNLVLSSVALSLLVIAFARAPTMWVACLILVALGFMLLVLQSLAITLVQLNTPDRVRGRVMSIYSMLHAGADTGGNLVIGTIAVPIGPDVRTNPGGHRRCSVFGLVLNFALPKIRRLN